MAESLRRLRATHEAYGLATEDLFVAMTRWSLARVAPRRVLDLGAGTGNWYGAIRTLAGGDVRYAGVDSDPDAVAALAGRLLDDDRATAYRADIRALPGEVGGGYDWVGMHFVLHHLDDPRPAVAAAFAAARPGGLVLVAANARRHLARWQAMHASVLASVGQEMVGPVSQRFTLEDGEAVFGPGRPFTCVRLAAGFRFPTADAAMDFYGVAMWRRGLRPEAQADPALRDAIRAGMRARVEAVVERDGAFAVEGETGFLAAGVGPQPA